MNFHESYNRPEKLKKNSERSFGLVMGAFFVILAISKMKPYLFVLAGLFLVLAWLKPSLLMHPNTLWHKLGELLHQLMSPIILTVMYFGVFCLFGLLMRLLKQVPLDSCCHLNEKGNQLLAKTIADKISNRK